MGVLEDITGEHVAAFADKSVTERNLEASGKLPYHPVFKQHCTINDTTVTGAAFWCSRRLVVSVILSAIGWGITSSQPIYPDPDGSVTAPVVDPAQQTLVELFKDIAILRFNNIRNYCKDVMTFSNSYSDVCIRTSVFDRQTTSSLYTRRSVFVGRRRRRCTRARP